MVLTLFPQSIKIMHMKLDQALFEKLVQVRDQLRLKERLSTGKNPTICSDEALFDMAQYKPRSPNEFECISGLGKVFQEKYGQAFADVIIENADKGFTTKMSSNISHTLKELEKNLITLNRKNRLLYTSQLRYKDGFDMSCEGSEDAIKFLFGRKQKIVIKNDENLKTLMLGFDGISTKKTVLSHYKKVVALLRETNRDLREKGQNNLYIAYPFVKGKLTGEDFNVRAPLAFFPVKAEKNSLAITITQDNSRDIIFNNALILANYKFNKIRRPLPNPVFEEVPHSPEELFTAVQNFYKEHELVMQRDPQTHNEKALTFEDDFSIKEFVNYKIDEFPVFRKGELYIEDVMVLGRYTLCDSTIQKDFDALLERKESTLQLDKLLKSFGQAQADGDEAEENRGLSPVSEQNLTYINSLNSSQEAVLTSMNNLDQLVVQGPPGTGKSQTITSLIVDYVLKDKTVLLVSEKKTALEVVYSRLGDLSKYALLIDDVGNKAAFYQQLQRMVMTASDTFGQSESLDNLSANIQTEMDKLEDIASSLFSKQLLGTEAFQLYQNSSKIDLKDFNSSKNLLKIENNFARDLLKLNFNELCQQKEIFSDEVFVQNSAYYLTCKKDYPWLLCLKSDLPDIDILKIKNSIEETNSQIAEWNQKNFFSKMFTKSKIAKKLKTPIADFISSSKFYSYTFKSPDEVFDSLQFYSKFQAAEKEYKKLNKISCTYLNAVQMIKTEEETYSDANNDLFNIILNIHISRFEAAHIQSLQYVKDYREIIRRIANAMAVKRKATVTNSALKLADYMTGLTESKRRNEINHALESTRKISVTKFINRFKPEVFDSVKIWMLTPEVVSELIPLQQGIFDLVIFDEASQMFVEKGIPSIFRAKKVVIAGDSKQLRPMKLFMGRFEDNPEEDDYTEETNEALEEQSLLDLARFKYENVMLKYHYRSKYEELIAFSNHAFYKGQLLVSPNAIMSDEPPIQVHKIPDGQWINTANKKEADYCVRLVKKILKERKNNETIGIITFNSHQHDMVEDCLDMECMRDKNFETALAAERNRRENGEDISLFVKNIENVQGDERDIIIFSVGFAKNADGKMYRNYGWLNNEGGENRLNVAISRAKSKIHIVTSVHPSELVVDDLKHDGPIFLKKYLEYCFAVNDGNSESTRNILSNLSNKAESLIVQNNTEFKNSVCEALRKKGFIVEQDVGIGGYSIDIALKYGKNFILGIECDSSLYNNSTETRERDFHRQKFLESRGWIVYRMYSSNWWTDPSAEIEKIKELTND